MFKLSDILKNPAVNAGYQQVLPPPISHKSQFKFPTIAILFIGILFGLSHKINGQLIATFQGTAPSQPCTYDGTLCCVSISGQPGSNYTPVLPYTCTIISPVGTFPYTHPCFNGLLAGNYTIQIQDAAGATGTVIATVPNSPSGLPPTTTIDVIPAGCAGGTGSACANVSGGSGSGFTYEWEMFDPPYTSFGTASCASNMPIGHYVLTVHDIGVPLCYYYHDVYIFEEISQVNITAQAATCEDPCNGYLNVDLSEVSLPATISWSGTSSGSVSGINTTSYLISGLCPGSYAVTIDDATTCPPAVVTSLGITTDNADIFINDCSGLIWNPAYFDNQNDITLGGDLIIASGACLTIENMTIRFSAGHRIRVNNQASLVCNNSVFDVGCNDLTWNGFSVLGVQSDPCDESSSRGRLSLTDCTITHADVGVTNFNLSSDRFGGQIHAVNTSWINNVRDIDLRNYSPTSSGSVGDYCSFFEECQFLLSATQPYVINHYRVFLNNVSDVRFRACNIINTVPALYIPNGFSSYGVYAVNSQFQWLGEDQSTISGIARGIWATGSFSNPDCAQGVIFASNDVTGTEFRCANGVYMNLVAACKVLSNTFLPLPAGFQNVTYRSIQIQAPGIGPHTTFFVADNLINFTGVTTGRVGIYIDDCKGFSNYVFRNTIYFGAPGMTFLNRNRAENDEEGLGGVHFECNNFHFCSKDIIVTCSNSDNCNQPTTGVAGLQANTFQNPGPVFNTSALNSFANSVSTSPRDDIDAGSNQGTVQPFRYVYRPLDFNDANYNSGNNTPTECSRLSDPAPYNIVSTELQTAPLSLQYCQNINYTIPDFVTIQQNLNQAIGSYNELHEIYAALVDGGNSEELKNNVLYSSYNQALELYEELMEKSPTLSEEVMLAAIAKDYELPASMLTIILAANPSSAKNPEIWKAIDERTETLDAYQRAEIMLGYYATSPKELLEAELGNYRSRVDYTIFQAMSFLSEHPNIDLINEIKVQIESLPIYETRFFLADLEMQHLNFESGYNKIVELKNSYKTKSSDQETLENYLELKQIHHNVVNRLIPQLTEEEIAVLEAYRSNDPCNLGALAQSILIGFSNVEELELFCDAERSLQTLNNDSKSVDNHYSVYPNPTNTGWIVIKLIEIAEQNCQVSIYDNTSRLVQQQMIQKNQQEIFLDVHELSPGSYWISTNQIGSVPTQLIIH